MNAFRVMHPSGIQLLASLVLSSTVTAATVTTCDEAGLRAAIAQGGTVDFACDGTITLTNTIEVTNDVALNGTGRQVVISGGGQVRLFQVNTGVVFSARGLVFANGRHQGTNVPTSVMGVGGDAQGGGFLNLGGTLNLVECLLTNHVAQGGNGSIPFASAGWGRGGAICAFGGQVNLTNCVLGQNQSKGGLAYAHQVTPNLSAGDSRGGAIYAQASSVAAHQTDFRSNAAVGGTVSGGDTFLSGSPGPAGQALGGALYTTSGIVVVSRSLFVGNRASGGQAFAGPGGGAASGGALYLVAGTSEVAGTQFLSNSVQAGWGARLASGGEGSGGAIHNMGELRVTACQLSANVATGGGGGGWYGYWPNASPRGIGGAISSSGNCAIEESLLDNNRANGGFGIELSPFGASPATNGCGGAIYATTNLALTNVTLFGNQATGGKGGINFGTQGASGAGQGGGVCVAGGTASMAHVTIAHNSAYGGVTGGFGITNIGAAQGGGVATLAGNVVFLSSILSSNLSGSNCFGLIIDAGHNISSDASCHFSAAGSLNNTDPLLGPLADNGGPTPSMALLAGSPAIDAADSTGCPDTDQRGIARPFGAACDIGAFESTSPSTTPGRLSIERTGIGAVRGVFAGEANQTFRVEVTGNLASWSPHSTNTTAGNGLFEFFDTNSATAQPRLFRVSKP